MKKYCMKLAFGIAKSSKAKRLQVGAVIMDSANRIIGSGINRMPKGFEDECEYLDANQNLVTKNELIHAEESAITFCAKHGNKTEGATIFITDSPCLSCAKLIYAAGITKVVYCRPYRITLGLEFLRKVGIEVEQLIIEL